MSVTLTGQRIKVSVERPGCGEQPLTASLPVWLAAHQVVLPETQPLRMCHRYGNPHHYSHAESLETNVSQLLENAASEMLVGVKVS